MTARTYELVGGPLCGELIQLPPGKMVLELVLEPAGWAAATSPDEDKVRPREGRYGPMLVAGEIVLAWLGEK